MPGSVQNALHQRRAIPISLAQNIGGNLNEIGIQLGLIPGGKHRLHFIGRHAQRVAHQLVCLADQLHIAILDAVVHHFNKVTRAVLPHIIAAGLAIHMGANGLKNILHLLPGSAAAARHHAGAMQRTLLAARYAGAQVVQALTFDILGAADGIGEVAVAAVDDGITRCQDGQQLRDDLIHRLARANHQHHLARKLQAVGQLLPGMRADKALACTAPLHKMLHHAGPHIVYRHGKAVAFHIHGQVFPHDCQANHANLRLFHAASSAK